MKVRILMIAAVAAWSAGVLPADPADGMPALPPWRPAGEVQVASLKTLAPQVAELGRMANFALLPMLIQQGVAGSPTGMALGAPRNDADWGVRLFVSDGRLESVTLWPLGSAGVSSARKAGKLPSLPGLPDQFAAYTQDGRWACVSEDAALAKRVATEGVAFAKPLKSGFVRAALSGREFFDGVEAMLRHDMAVLAAMSGEKYDGDGNLAAIGAFAKGLESARATFGLSRHGLDLRLKATPRAGAPLEDASQPLPQSVLDAAKEANLEIAAFGENAAGAPLPAPLLAAIPEAQRVKGPLFSLKIPLGSAGVSPAKTEPLAAIWGLVWRDGHDYRAILRIPSAALPEVFKGMIQLQASPM